jgi:hypothetical protein
MPNELLLAIGFLTAVAAWIALEQVIAAQQVLRQRRIAAIGIQCQGRVVAIQRPFMLDDCTRLYFDFVPAGGREPVRACHIARPSQDTQIPKLPAHGTVVSVRYLPERPQLAVIGPLVNE